VEGTVGNGEGTAGNGFESGLFLIYLYNRTTAKEQTYYSKMK
jgi:hypothetical protein